MDLHSLEFDAWYTILNLLEGGLGDIFNLGVEIITKIVMHHLFFFLDYIYVNVHSAMGKIASETVFSHQKVRKMAFSCQAFSR